MSAQRWRFPNHGTAHEPRQVFRSGFRFSSREKSAKLFLAPAQTHAMMRKPRKAPPAASSTPAAWHFPAQSGICRPAKTVGPASVETMNPDKPFRRTHPLFPPCTASSLLLKSTAGSASFPPAPRQGGNHLRAGRTGGTMGRCGQASAMRRRNGPHSSEHTAHDVQPRAG